MGSAPLAVDSSSVHTASMSLRTASLLALIGMVVLTIVLAADFISAIVAVARGLLPAIVLVRSLIYLFAAITVTMFFYVFQRSRF